MSRVRRVKRRDHKLGASRVGNDLQDKPAFLWWVPHILKKRHRIISSVMKRYLNRNNKFGIEIAATWNDCVRLDTDNNNTLWQDAVHKEM
jgi:hypothetical protein